MDRRQQSQATRGGWGQVGGVDWAAADRQLSRGHIWVRHERLPGLVLHDASAGWYPPERIISLPPACNGRFRRSADYLRTWRTATVAGVGRRARGGCRRWRAATAPLRPHHEQPLPIQDRRSPGAGARSAQPPQRRSLPGSLPVADRSSAAPAVSPLQPEFGRHRLHRHAGSRQQGKIGVYVVGVGSGPAAVVGGGRQDAQHG